MTFKIYCVEVNKIQWPKEETYILTTGCSYHCKSKIPNSYLMPEENKNVFPKKNLWLFLEVYYIRLHSLFILKLCTIHGQTTIKRGLLLKINIHNCYFIKKKIFPTHCEVCIKLFLYIFFSICPLVLCNLTQMDLYIRHFETCENMYLKCFSERGVAAINTWTKLNFILNGFF